jgi:spore cortex biosynthesis protein YabQ
MFGISNEQQFIVFLNFALIGSAIGFVFELFRAFGKVFQFKRFTGFFVDFFLCMLASIYIYIALFVWNYGEVRFFIFFALALGIIFYYLIISPHIYKHLILTFKYIRFIIVKILKWKNALQDFINKKRIICIRRCNRFRNYLKKYFLKEKENQNEKE